MFASVAILVELASASVAVVVLVMVVAVVVIVDAVAIVVTGVECTMTWNVEKNNFSSKILYSFLSKNFKFV